MERVTRNNLRPPCDQLATIDALPGQGKDREERNYTMKTMKEEYVGLNPKDMTASDLLTASTYCNSWINLYLEEVCRRTGNLAAYKEDPMKAAKAAAKGYGSILI